MEINDGNVKPLSSHQINNAPSDFCMTSLTSSGIGSMKSSTLSVTTGSPMPIHFTSGIVEEYKVAIPDITENVIPKPTETVHKTTIAPTVPKKLAVINSNDDITDVEDVDTSGIFSISESSPLKKSKSTSQVSLQNDAKMSKNVVEGNSTNAVFRITNTLQNNPELEKDNNALNASNCNNKEKVPFRNEFTGRITPQDTAALQKLNSAMVIKKERLESEEQNRRKGTILV